ncbi:MAG: hypothetical protein CBD58_02495 [bacterium TMED198]|nr:MAG: hypothetical protein CBD58_02495 [bacterium TMED198]
MFCVLISQISAFLLLNIGQGFSQNNIRSVVFYIVVFLLQAGISLGIIKCCLQIIDKDSFEPSQIYKQFDFLLSYLFSIAIIAVFGALVFFPTIMLIYNKNILNLSLGSLQNTIDSIEKIATSLSVIDTLFLSVSSLMFLYISLRFFFVPYFIVDRASPANNVEALSLSYQLTKGKTLQLVPMFLILIVLGYLPNIVTFFFLPLTILLPCLYFRNLNKL